MGEPSRVEWHIARAVHKAKELKRPLGMKSQAFCLKGLREVAMEFYPEGNHNSAEGFGVVRIFMPQDAHVRYQLWIGRSSEGVREHAPDASPCAGCAGEAFSASGDPFRAPAWACSWRVWSPALP